VVITSVTSVRSVNTSAYRVPSVCDSLTGAATGLLEQEIDTMDYLTATIELQGHSEKHNRGHAASVDGSCGDTLRVGHLYRCDLLPGHPSNHHVCGASDLHSGTWSIEWSDGGLVSQGL